MRLRIKFHRAEGIWYAVPQNLPGCPPSGTGLTRRAAVKDFFQVLIMVSKCNKPGCHNWLDMIDWTLRVELL